MIKFFKNNYKKIIYYLWGIILIISTLSINNINNKPIEKNYKKTIALEENSFINDLIDNHQNEINFYSLTFGINKDILIDKIKIEQNLFKDNNFDRTLLNYLENLEKTESDLFNNELISCNKDKEYIISLISYFSNLYENVDFKIAASIAMVESGFQSKNMLNKNNIFGGMYQGKVIQYKNIEYGVYKYIKMLSEGYFDKGLNTIEKIGIHYNPTYNENGQKIAKPSWVYNVNNQMDKFNDYEGIDSISKLIITENNNSVD